MEIKNKLDEMLIEACKKGRFEIVMMYVSSLGSKDINEKFDNGSTLLMCACSGGEFEYVNFLVSYGAKINEKDNDGRTALMYASRINIVEYLISKGANVQEKDNHGRTALIWASWMGNKDVVEYLVSQKANVHEKDNVGRTALMYASGINIVEYLISKGANVQEKDNDGRTTLMWASWMGNKDVVEYLVSQKANVHEKDNKERHLLIFAVIGNKIVRDLKIDSRINEMIEKFHYSIQEEIENVFYHERTNNPEAVKIILQNFNSTHIMHADQYGKTALHYAAKQGFYKSVELLIKAMKKHVTFTSFINCKDKYGHTALSLAANYRQHYGHSVSSLANYGLHMTVKLLLDNGADPYIPNKNGDTALFWAMARGHEDTVKELKS